MLLFWLLGSSHPGSTDPPSYTVEVFDTSYGTGAGVGSSRTEVIWALK